MRRAFVTRLGPGVVGLYLIVAMPGAILADTCVGDCDGGGAVSIDELITGVTIALGTVAAGACPALDCPQHIGGVFIDCAVEAVYNALHGCPVVAPTPVTDCSGVPRDRPCMGPCGGPACAHIISGYCEGGRCLTECAPCVTPTEIPTRTTDCRTAPNAAPCLGACGLGFCEGSTCVGECTPSATGTRPATPTPPTPSRTPIPLPPTLTPTVTRTCYTPATRLPDQPCDPLRCAFQHCVRGGFEGQCEVDHFTGECLCFIEGPTPTITPVSCTTPMPPRSPTSA